MTPATDSQIKKLTEDISLIKSVISRNKKVIQMILLPTHFRLLYLVSGISLIGFSLVIYLMMEHYGSYSGIPHNYIGIIYLAMLIDWALLAFIKFYKWKGSLSKIDKRYDLGFALEGFFSFRIVHVYLPLLILMIVISVFFVQRGTAYYVIPTISIGTGLMHNLIGSVTRLWQWIVTGYWLLIAGLFLLATGPLSIPLAVSISLGCGCILFGVTGWVPHASKKE